MEVCPNSDRDDSPEAYRSIWDPHVIFPELCTTKPHSDRTVLNAKPANAKKVPKKSTLPPSAPLRRTSRVKQIKGKEGQSGLIEVRPGEFLDVPLQYAEGREILTAIGGSTIPIPPGLMISDLSDGLADKPDKGPAKRTKRATQSAQGTAKGAGPSNIKKAHTTLSTGLSNPKQAAHMRPPQARSNTPASQPAKRSVQGPPHLPAIDESNIAAADPLPTAANPLPTAADPPPTAASLPCPVPPSTDDASLCDDDLQLHDDNLRLDDDDLQLGDDDLQIADNDPYLDRVDYSDYEDITA